MSIYQLGIKLCCYLRIRKAVADAAGNLVPSADCFPIVTSDDTPLAIAGMNFTY